MIPNSLLLVEWEDLEPGEETLSTLHLTPSLSSVRGDLLTASLRGSLLLPPPPSQAQRAQHLPLHLGSESVLQQAQRLWGQDALEFRVSRDKGNLQGKGETASLSCPPRPLAAAPPKAWPNLPTCPGREALQGGLPFSQERGLLRASTSGRMEPWVPAPTWLYIHPTNKY